MEENVEPTVIYKVCRRRNGREISVFHHVFSEKMANELLEAEQAYAKAPYQICVETVLVYPDYVITGDDIVNNPF